MFYFAVGFAVWLHVFCWGAGVAVLAMPKPWRAWWPLLAWPAGLALQSLVVWLAVYAGLPGTNSYAWWVEVIPVALAIVAVRRRGAGTLRVEIVRLWGVWALMALNLIALLVPLAAATRGLNTLSLGSQDAPDYAAGARVLMEFAHADRGGFLGLTEVVRVMSVDNFYDFWLRLNHFTPSALIAFNGTIVDCLPHELTSIVAALSLTCSLPVVFLIARLALGYGAGVSWWVAALYGFSPVTWYAVYHLAMGQLLAAPAIALLSWAGVALWQRRASRVRGAPFAGLLAIAYVLLLGSYNFILLVCLAPALAFAGGDALRRSEWKRLAAWLCALLLPAVLCALVFWPRIAGLGERFALFRVFNFGWRIPMLTPEGWLGFIATHQLQPLGTPLRISLAAVAAIALFVALVHAWRHRRGAAYVAACLIVPPLVGYFYLQWRGLERLNASYDAYKILAVFFPGVLAASVFWAGWGLGRGRVIRNVVLLAMAAVLAAHLHAAWLFAKRMENPPLGVSRELVQLRRLEADPQIRSLNILLTDGWSRLWANAYLLRIPQYFATHTYEGRLNTPLRGEWDLTGGVTDISLPQNASRRLGPHYSLLDTRSPYFFRVRFGHGWHELEQPFGLPEQWRWTRRDAELHLHNPQHRSLTIDLQLKVRTLEPQVLHLWMNGQLWKTVRVGTAPEEISVATLSVPPGESTLEFRADDGAKLTTGDVRELEFAFYRIGLSVRE